VTGPAERIRSDQAVRLLRAKAAELEARVLADFRGSGEVDEIGQLQADVALLAILLADTIEAGEP
jgi:hypothetical protein